MKLALQILYAKCRDLLSLPRFIWHYIVGLKYYHGQYQGIFAKIYK